MQCLSLTGSGGANMESNSWQRFIQVSIMVAILILTEALEWLTDRLRKQV